MKLRDKCWLWGHPEGRYNNEYGNTQISRMTPMEGCLYLGVKNTFMVPVGWDVNYRQYNKSFTTLNNVGWEFGDAAHRVIGDVNTVNEYLERAKDFPNITCAVFDDYKSCDKHKNVTLEHFQSIHDRFHNNEIRRMDTWMVLYTWEFGNSEEEDKDFMQYIKPFDGVMMWTKKDHEILEIPKKFEIFKKMTPNNKRMFGCYLWNFGESREADPDLVKWQLDFYREKMLSGEVEGICLHTNTMADLDLKAYDVAVAWMKEHGDEEFPE